MAPTIVVSHQKPYALVLQTFPLVTHCHWLDCSLTSLASERMHAFRDVMTKSAQVLVLPFPRRPESVFEGVEMPTAIWLRRSGAVPLLTTSCVRRFYTTERPDALATTQLMSRRLEEPALRIPKIDGRLGHSILSKLKSSRVVDILTSKCGEYNVFYQEACRYWAKSSTFPPRFIRNGEVVDQPHGRTIGFSDTACRVRQLFAQLILVLLVLLNPCRLRTHQRFAGEGFSLCQQIGRGLIGLLSLRALAVNCVDRPSQKNSHKARSCDRVRRDRWKARATLLCKRSGIGARHSDYQMSRWTTFELRHQVPNRPRR